MKVSPSVFCILILPLGILSLIASVIVVTHKGGTSENTVPAFWLYMFLGGGPSTVGLAGILFHIRRHERTPFAKIDRLAISLPVLTALTVGSIVLSMHLRTRKLQRELPNQSASTNHRPAGQSAHQGAKPSNRLPNF